MRGVALRRGALQGVERRLLYLPSPRSSTMIGGAHLGQLARESGAPGRGGGSAASCWSGRASKGGAPPVGTLFSIKYITPRHDLVAQAEISDRRNGRKAREPAGAGGGQASSGNDESGPKGRTVTLTARQLDPLHVSRSHRGSPTLRVAMRSSQGYFGSLSYASLGDEPHGTHKGLTPPALKVRHDRPSARGAREMGNHSSSASNSRGGSPHSGARIDMYSHVSASSLQLLPTPGGSRKRGAGRHLLSPTSSSASSPPPLQVVLPDKLDWVATAHIRSPHPELAKKSPANLFRPPANQVAPWDYSVKRGVPPPQQPQQLSTSRMSSASPGSSHDPLAAVEDELLLAGDTERAPTFALMAGGGRLASGAAGTAGGEDSEEAATRGSARAAGDDFSAVGLQMGEGGEEGVATTHRLTPPPLEDRYDRFAPQPMYACAEEPEMTEHPDDGGGMFAQSSCAHLSSCQSSVYGGAAVGCAGVGGLTTTPSMTASCANLRQSSSQGSL